MYMVVFKEPTSFKGYTCQLESDSQCQVTTKPSLQFALDCPISVVHNSFLMRINKESRSFSTHTNLVLSKRCGPFDYVVNSCR